MGQLLRHRQINPMEPIYIPQLLRMPDQTETLTLEKFTSDLETLTPVRGYIKVTHAGNYLEVQAQAETIVTLKCDRCLKQYNYRLSLDTTELIWLEEEGEEVPLVETETKLEELYETLDPQGYFPPDIWLYEHLCLELPMRQLCDQNCEGVGMKTANPPLIDSRWAGLEVLKQNLQ